NDKFTLRFGAVIEDDLLFDLRVEITERLTNDLAFCRGLIANDPAILDAVWIGIHCPLFLLVGPVPVCLRTVAQVLKAPVQFGFATLRTVIMLRPACPCL